MANVFNNRVEITKSALKTLKNNTEMASRVARRWDGDFTGSVKIGDTLKIRKPGYMEYRTGATASPSSFNDTYASITIAQGGADMQLTTKELTLSVNEFNKQVTEPLIATVIQQIDKSLADQAMKFHQFSGKIGTAVNGLVPFLNAKAVMESQAAVRDDGKLSALLNPYTQANMIGGMSTLLNPSKEISDQYRNGSLGYAGGLDFYSSANAPTQILGTWSGTLVVGGTLPADGATAFTIGGMTGTFAVGENFTIAGVHALNPQGKAVQGELKQFVVTSQVGTTVNFSPAMILTGPQRNIDALPIAGAAVYPWGTDAASALAAGTGQIVKVSPVFHEEAIAFAMADLVDTTGFGGATCTRVKDDLTGLRLRSSFWYNGTDDSALYRLDVLFGSGLLREGHGSKVIG
jgi:hypothetical protein